MSRERYPELKRGPDGRKRCRGCGGPIPPRKDGGEDERKTWCSRECYDKYEPRRVIGRVSERAGGKCERCGWDFTIRRIGEPYRTAEYHHIIPFSEGGQTTDENMQQLCDVCHREVTRQWHAEKAKQKRRERQSLPLFENGNVQV